MRMGMGMELHVNECGVPLECNECVAVTYVCECTKMYLNVDFPECVVYVPSAVCV